ncbi:TadE/TadG family type IV pilus assembly protein [Noviherbaspirillum galbum]|uniref:Pilus assembly protein n=1 Tax=Noviherbaspirillum galbum TaxID=2709383 RepID=A0A6B3SP27_9BURK|nr:TadE family protein [Noviherbaspirillum galbum]NEX61045.1 pilus assembly protein [Noviherbaspirillum galbum]
MTSRQNGVALVEFALILPLLLILTFIVTEFGRALYQYNTITKSVRDAARYLSMQPPNTGTAQARNLVVYGNTAGTGNPLALGLTAANVPDPTWTQAGTYPVMNLVTISVTGYTFRSMMPSAFGINFGNFAFSPISATMRSPL